VDYCYGPVLQGRVWQKKEYFCKLVATLLTLLLTPLFFGWTLDNTFKFVEKLVGNAVKSCKTKQEQAYILALLLFKKRFLCAGQT
jgi:hypothetical protein